MVTKELNGEKRNNIRYDVYGAYILGLVVGHTVHVLARKGGIGSVGSRQEQEQEIYS